MPRLSQVEIEEGDMVEHNYKNWDEAYREGGSLLITAMRVGDAPEQDIVLGRLAAKALLIGLEREWISDMLEAGCEQNIEQRIKRRTH